MKTSDDRSPAPMDFHVGSRVRLRRLSLGWSVERLANEAGVSRQQLEKWEKGDTRMTAGRIHAVALALDVSPAFFFEGMPHSPLPTDSGADLAQIATAAGIEHLTLFNGLMPPQRSLLRALMEDLVRANEIIERHALIERSAAANDDN
jgi:transcriptional regulator with XRE-family HTH domain